MSLLIFEVFATAAVLLSTASVWYIRSCNQVLNSPEVSPKVLEFTPTVPARSGRNLGPRNDIQEQPVFLTAEDRRAKIASLASDPEYLEKLEKIRKSRRFFGIRPDPEAQNNHAAWRVRQQR
jgi:hypothetical protein